MKHSSLSLLTIALLALLLGFVACEPLDSSFDDEDPSPEGEPDPGEPDTGEPDTGEPSSCSEFCSPAIISTINDCFVDEPV